MGILHELLPDINGRDANDFVTVFAFGRLVAFVVAFLAACVGILLRLLLCFQLRLNQIEQRAFARPPISLNRNRHRSSAFFDEICKPAYVTFEEKLVLVCSDVSQNLGLCLFLMFVSHIDSSL